MYATYVLTIQVIVVDYDGSGKLEQVVQQNVVLQLRHRDWNSW